MGLYDAFETDPDLEKNGIYIDYGDFRVRIAFAGATNKKYSNYSEKQFKPLRHAINAGTIDNERSLNILQDIFAQTIVLDWDTKVGEEEDGSPIWKQGIEPKTGGDLLPFNKENVKKTFHNLPALFLDIKAQAESISNFRQKEMEADSGNSSSS